MEAGKIYAASTGAKRGGRQPRSETVLPKSTMSLQESWRGETEGLGRHGRRRRETEQGKALGDRAAGHRTCHCWAKMIKWG